MFFFYGALSLIHYFEVEEGFYLPISGVKKKIQRRVPFMISYLGVQATYGKPEVCRLLEKWLYSISVELSWPNFIYLVIRLSTNTHEIFTKLISSLEGKNKKTFQPSSKRKC